MLDDGLKQGAFIDPLPLQQQSHDADLICTGETGRCSTDAKTVLRRRSFSRPLWVLITVRPGRGLFLRSGLRTGWRADESATGVRDASGRGQRRADFIPPTVLPEPLPRGNKHAG